MIKFKKGSTFTDVTTYKRFVGGAWQDILVGKFKGASAYVTYWDRDGFKIQRPPEGTYVGAGGFVVYPSSAGSNAYLLRFASDHTATVTGTYSPWKIPSQTFVTGDTVQIYVTKVNGDMEAHASSAVDTWLALYPGSTTYQWWAENSTSVRRALFKVTLKDQDNRTVEWWMDCTNKGPTVVYYSDPTVPPDTGGGGGGGGTVYPSDKLV